MLFVSIDTRMNITMKHGQTRIIDGQVIKIPSKTVQFEAGRFKTEDPKTIAFLRNRPTFGSRIFEGVAPDDLVATEGHSKVYASTYKKCDFEAGTKDLLLEHRADVHPKKTKK